MIKPVPNLLVPFMLLCGISKNVFGIASFEKSIRFFSNFGGSARKTPSCRDRKKMCYSKLGDYKMYLVKNNRGWFERL